MTDTTIRKKLEDRGTRFEHLADFQDYVGEGLLAVTNSFRTYKNDSDKIKLVQMESVMRFIQKYQELLALDKDGRNYSGQQFDMNRLLDANVPTKEVLAAIRTEINTAAPISKAKTDQKDQNENDADTSCA